MNVVFKTVVASMAILMASVSGVHAAGAGTGTISFEGEILEAACSIVPTSVDQTIPLGQVAKSQLSTGGVTSPKVFKFELTGCVLTGLTDKT
ncbi:fimbrial protein [Pseudomonas sp. MS-1(2024)]|nr:fimbrial protein [Pseudomonas sp. MS-1(2024)]MEC4167153.1 fimbrial protein [Pseudomonas sp. MS-1(2024)]